MMYKSLSISQKIHIPIIMLMIVGISIVILNSIYSIGNITKESRNQYIKNMRDDIVQGIHEKKQIGLTSVISLSKNRDIIEALKTDNRELAYKVLDDLSKTYRESTDYKNIKIHIHSKDVKSFLRHWNQEKFGDDLSSFRTSLLKVKKEKKPFVTLESGRAGMLIRGIAPIFDNDTYLGSIEFIQGFNSLVKKYQKLKNYDLLFLAYNNDNIKRFKKDVPKVSDFYLSQKLENSNKELIDLVDGFDPQQIEKDLYMIKGDYFVSSLFLKNDENKREGIALIATDFHRVNNFVDKSKKSLLQQVYILVIIDIFLLLLVLIILNKVINRPIEELYRAILRIENSLDGTDLKTLYTKNKLTIHSNDELSKIKEGLNLLLKSISTNFTKLRENEQYTSEYIKAVDAGSIVSKSDSSGRITYVNDAFCNITGYTREELIGNPHSIFRDPTTPKSLYKDMWHTIESGNIYRGLFKNRRKNTTSFYANITIVPIKNDKNKVVEYLALRDDVTELVNSKEKLKKVFFTDPLTSFYNRFKLLDDITKNNNSYLAVIDIHEFREINDFYGYKIGDSLLVDFANRLFEYFGTNTYTVYRIHGDEFAILANQKYISRKEFYEFIKAFIETIKGILQN